MGRGKIGVKQDHIKDSPINQESATPHPQTA